ncbi:putative topless-related protein 4-like [Forsythia ovata]|uniref:Topless-related protein 4-like n=1 Tax=Forsythia ovata TaxID=205694 RepID=A0ABD1TS50_9LAMI
MARQLKGSDGIRVLAISYNCFYCDPSVAYSKHIVHIYAYHGGDDLRNHLEIDAHGGNVSDLAFSNPNKQLCIITCGEDKAIKEVLNYNFYGRDESRRCQSCLGKGQFGFRLVFVMGLGDD